MEYTELIILLLVGLLGGFLSGLIGIGGGLIFVPVFDIFLQRSGIVDSELVRFILANSFLTIIFSGIIASQRQYKANNFYPTEILYTALPAIVSGMLVSFLITQLDWYSETSFKWLFMSMLAYVVYKTLFLRSPDTVQKNPSKKGYVVTGIITGMASGLSGLGGGVIMIPAFTTFMGLDMKKASSISIGVIPVLLLPIACYYGFTEHRSEIQIFHIGYLLPAMVLPMIAGILMGAPYGVKMGHRLNNRRLEIIFAGVVLLIMAKYLIELLS